jgi:hypothetical protein
MYHLEFWRREMGFTMFVLYHIDSIVIDIQQSADTHSLFYCPYIVLYCGIPKTQNVQ